MTKKRLPPVPRRMHCKYCYGHRSVEIVDGFQIECSNCQHRLSPPVMSLLDLRKWLRGDEDAREVFRTLRSA